MKIWLDDIRLPPSIEWTHFFTAKDVINALKTVPVDEISLDHDLGLPESIYGTGYECAVFIEEGAFTGSIPRLKWHIHSQNVVGVEKMRKALQNANYLWGIDQEEEDRI